MKRFNAVTSEKLYVQIYEQIYRAIINGEYKIGDMLPSEHQLCEQFNVSRVPVREALCALELNGLIESKQGSRVFVRCNYPANIWTEGVEPQDVNIARRILEPHIAKAAAQNISDLDKQVLRNILIRFRDEASMEQPVYDADFIFHRFLAKASGNFMFAQFMELVYQGMDQDIWKHIFKPTMATVSFKKINADEHIEIGELVLAGDADGAYAAMDAHMEKFLQRFWEENS